MNIHRKKSFTLIEILVVVTIISVLMAVGVTSYSSINKRSRDTKRKSDIEQIRSALEMYRSDNGSYINGSDISTLVTNSYITNIPKDPKGASYLYTGTNCVAAICYGYTIQGNIEGVSSGVASPDATCTPSLPTYNYCAKNP
jgi:general secretion pathway protein G